MNKLMLVVLTAATLTAEAAIAGPLGSPLAQIGAGRAVLPALTVAPSLATVSAVPRLPLASASLPGLAAPHFSPAVLPGLNKPAVPCLNCYELPLPYLPFYVDTQYLAHAKYWAQQTVADTQYNFRLGRDLVLTQVSWFQKPSCEQEGGCRPLRDPSWYVNTLVTQGPAHLLSIGQGMLGGGKLPNPPPSPVIPYQD